MHWTRKAINDIKSTCIAHRNWVVARAHACSVLFACAPGEVVCITGPSRAGKSRLIDELEVSLVGSVSPTAARMPVVKLTATNCGQGGQFSTKWFALHALDTMRHPFYGYDNGPAEIDDALFSRVERTPESTFNRAFRKAIGLRGVLYLFIDEAQHVLYAKGGMDGAAAVLDYWKCLVGNTRVVLVLVGAYPLLRAISFCPHLIGRKHQVHLPRYGSDSEDREEFDRLLKIYDQFVRLGPGIDSLVTLSDYLYEGSLGCIGLLEAWLRGALAIADAAEQSYITKEHFDFAAKSNRERQIVASEIAQGEEDLNSELRLPGENVSQPEVERRGTRSRKPFARNPKRNKIGGRM